MTSSWRNIVIFGLVVLGGGFLGVVVNSATGAANPMEGLGTLIWLVSPVMANLLLRWLGGDGWRDAGFGLGDRRAWPAYLAALAIPVVVAGAALAVALAAGVVTLNAAAIDWGIVAAAVGTTFAGSAVKNVFEEFAWRGYLTPRLEALRAPAPLAWWVTGVIWAGWHIPYYLYFLDQQTLAEHTSLSPIALILLALLLLPLQAIAYAEIRLWSGSVWPTWLMHGVANALSLPLVAGGFVSSATGLGIILAPGTEGVLYSLLMGAIGLALWRARTGVKTNDERRRTKAASLVQ